MSILGDARQAIVDKLSLAGLVGVLDPTAIHPPCVLIGPPDIERLAVGGQCVTVTAVFPVVVLVVGPGNGGSLDQLLGDVPAAMIALAHDKPSEATPAVYVVETNGQAREYPAYEFTCTKMIRINP